MTEAFFSGFQTIAQYSVLRMVDSLAWGTLVTIVAATLFRFAGRQSAGTRFAIWYSALLAIAVVPIITAVSWHAGRTSPAAQRSAVTLPDAWALYLFAAWAIPAVWMLAGVGRAVWHLRVLRGKCVELNSLSLDSLLQATLQRVQAKRSISLCVSDDVRVPTAIGLARPAIVFPRWALRELSAAELNQVLLHELAHLRRWDDWTNLAQQIVKALFFFHPAVWWIESRASLEREIACDDAVLEETKSPRAYAECLAHLAERSFVQRSVALAQAVLGRFRQTSTRVAEILAADRPQESRRNWKPAVALLASFTLLGGFGASRAPRLVAFSDSRAQTSASTSTRGSQNFVTPAQEFPQVAPVTQAKFTSKATRPKSMLHRREILRPASGPRHVTAPALHLTSLKREIDPYTATVVLLVQGLDRTYAGQTYQIQMWRVTWVRFVVEPIADSAPSKKT